MKEKYFDAKHKEVRLGDWVYYPKMKICGLVIGLDNQTGFMKVHCFKTMELRWLTKRNFGQYMIL